MSQVPDVLRPTRRQFVQGLGVTGLGLLAGCGRLPWPAPARVPRVGVLWTTNRLDLSHFQDGLRELGYVEGQNVVLETRFPEERLDRIPDLAAELVHLPIDVLSS